MTNKGQLFGKYPAIVKSYDSGSRKCKVSIPSVTDNADDVLSAEIEFPIGDRSSTTEIRILSGDKVWVEFIQGDPRNPIITGFRNPITGNSSGTRHWEHENIDLKADTAITLTAGSSIELVVGSTSLKLTADQIALIAATIANTGAVTVSETLGVTGDATINGISVSGHKHTDSVGGTTSAPIK